MAATRRVQLRTGEMTMARHHYNTKHPICPHCEYEFNADEMVEHHTQDDTMLYTLAHDEGIDSIECPQCDQVFWVEGSWQPTFTTALAEEDL